MSHHPDFATLQASRPQFNTAHNGFTLTQAPSPSWTAGTPSSSSSSSTAPGHKTLSIDPSSPARTTGENYKLLVSAIIPRPIGFVSTVSATGTRNLAPFSYFSLASHDPPIFTLGFSAGTGGEKDTCANLRATRECTVSIVSEDFAHAANACAVDAPADVDEWRLAGLSPRPSDVVAPPRVAESRFAVEARLVAEHVWTSPRDGRKTGSLVILEGVRLHVAEDALRDGVVDPAVLRPVSRLGGITYGRTTEGFELLRPRWAEEREKEEVKRALLNGEEKEEEEVKN